LSLDAWLIFRLEGSGGVDQAAVVGGELLVGPVELGVVEVGSIDAGLQVVRLLLPDALCGRACSASDAILVNGLVPARRAT